MQNRGRMGRSRSNADPKQRAADTVRPAGTAASSRPAALIGWSAALLALTLTVFAPVRHFSFVSWDDPRYVSENPVVGRGLTLSGVVWALTSPGQFYWHPITWLSHMADVQVFGMRAGAHHVTNLVLHAAATLLLFWVLRRMTGRTGRSALVAALFAVHPLHVESVAWIAERKDVLSGLFWMLTLWAYAGYVRTPGRARYAAVTVFFALGLMSKPTLVMLPLVLLLLDVWPLNRMGPAEPALRPRARRPPASNRVAGLLFEKIPLFALSIAGSAATFLAQLHVGAVEGLDTLPLRERLSNAAVSSVGYVLTALWPARLAAFYPFRPVAGWWVACCLLILAGLSYAAVRARGRRPYLTVGWLWYLAVLLPAIGLVQVGSQSMADRFTYLPLIGLTVALVWGVGDLLASWRVPRLAVGASALALVAACAGSARAQVRYWRDSETLWQRAVDVVPNNDLAHANLGLVLAAAGRSDEALAHFSEAVRILETPEVWTGTGRGTPPPDYAALLHGQVGLLLGRQGRMKEAIPHLREVVGLRPARADARQALAQALASDGELDEAIGELREALRLEPGRAELHGDLASVQYRVGDLAGAIAQLEEALRRDPAHRSAATWHYNLAAMLNERGRRAEAIRELQAALRVDAGYEPAQRALTELLKGPR